MTKSGSLAGASAPSLTEGKVTGGNAVRVRLLQPACEPGTANKREKGDVIEVASRVAAHWVPNGVCEMVEN